VRAARTQLLDSRFDDALQAVIVATKVCNYASIMLYSIQYMTSAQSLSISSLQLREELA
jgi:hypothetical protein